MRWIDNRLLRFRRCSPTASSDVLQRDPSTISFFLVALVLVFLLKSRSMESCGVPLVTTFVASRPCFPLQLIATATGIATATPACTLITDHEVLKHDIMVRRDLESACWSRTSEWLLAFDRLRSSLVRRVGHRCALKPALTRPSAKCAAGHLPVYRTNSASFSWKRASSSAYIQPDSPIEEKATFLISPIRSCC